MIKVELHNRSDTLVKVLSGAIKAAYHAQLNSDGTATFLIHRADPDFTTYNVAFGGIDGYIVHLLRKGPYESTFTDRFVFVVEACTGTLGEQEDAGAWWRISGRGTLCLLEDRLSFPPGYDGITQGTITNPFLVYTASPGGLIMAAEIDRSNPRFAINLTHSNDVQATYQATVLADAPTHYYRLGETSGTAAVDIGSVPSNGVYSGGPTLGVIGAIFSSTDTAVHFNGNPHKMTIPGTTGFPSGASAWSLEAWLKFDGFPLNLAILAYGNLAVANGLATIGVDSSGRPYVGGTSTRSALKALPVGTWHHIVGTYDGSNLWLYQDGLPVVGPFAATLAIPAGGATGRVAARNNGGVDEAWMIGTIDEAAFYTTTLTAAKVLKHYQAGVGYVGTSQTTVLQTAQLRFDNLRKVHDYLIGNGVDGQMIGLDYQATDHRGSDKSATVTVAMASQDSLLGVTLERDASKVANYVVAQGVGEGANALLVSASDSPSITALRRREGFLAATQDSDATQIGLRATSAVAQLKSADQRITTRFIDSPHTQLYRNFDLGDTVKCAVAPIGMTQNYRCVGITVTDQDSEVEDCALDLNSIRQEYLLKLATGATLTSDGLGVITRLPPAIMQVLLSGGTQTVGPITGHASPPLGLSGVGGEVTLVTGTFTLARPGNVLLEAICSDFVFCTVAFTSSHPVYFQIDGINDPSAYGYVPVWANPGNAETRTLSTTIQKVASLAAGSHTVNVIWNSQEGGNDTIYNSNNPLFAFLLGS